ncbi:hypothetical protein Tco_1225975 [Tanacetum coccineum]
MLTMLIPGPKSPAKDIDVYLQPLIKELQELWKGVWTKDAATGTYFEMKAALLWTINDFPARSSLSGWSGQGYYACPTCNEDTPSMAVKNKIAYVGHRRFLKTNHPLRNKKKEFHHLGFPEKNATDNRSSTLELEWRDDYGQLEENLSSLISPPHGVLVSMEFHKNNQYILATQVTQVFYLQDLARPTTWLEGREHVYHGWWQSPDPDCYNMMACVESLATHGGDAGGDPPNRPVTLNAKQRVQRINWPAASEWEGITQVENPIGVWNELVDRFSHTGIRCEKRGECCLETARRTPYQPNKEKNHLPKRRKNEYKVEHGHYEDLIETWRKTHSEPKSADGNQRKQQRYVIANEGHSKIEVRGGVNPFMTDQHILDQVVPSENRQNMTGMGQKQPGSGSTSQHTQKSLSKTIDEGASGRQVGRVRRATKGTNDVTNSEGNEESEEGTRW